MRLTGCGPEDFADGNLKNILSVIWQVILKYQIQPPLANVGMFIFSMYAFLTLFVIFSFSPFSFRVKRDCKRISVELG